MFIRTYDEDIDFDDHLDNIFIEMQLAESNNFTANEDFTGDMTVSANVIVGTFIALFMKIMA